MIRHGGCLCKGVRYEVRGHFAPPVACHCSQCAKTSGSHAVMASCRSKDLHLSSAETLAWFASSKAVARGFCTRCGGNLFWKAEPGAEVYVTLGSLDQPTGLRLSEHIFVASKSDFYEIADALPQKDEW